MKTAHSKAAHSGVSNPALLESISTGMSVVDLWHRAAEADYELCRQFAAQCDARLPRSLRSQRLGWDRDGKSVYGILMPDPLVSSPATSGDWYIYYTFGETLFRRTEAERIQRGMLVLPESTDDWAELLRQALRQEIFDVRYTVTPHYINAFGEMENECCGYEFLLTAHGPHTGLEPRRENPQENGAAFQITGTGLTPEGAARNAARRWLSQHH